MKAAAFQGAAGTRPRRSCSAATCSSRCCPCPAPPPGARSSSQGATATATGPRTRGPCMCRSRRPTHPITTRRRPPVAPGARTHTRRWRREHTAADGSAMAPSDRGRAAEPVRRECRDEPSYSRDVCNCFVVAGVFFVG
ncbi:hypothetical protein PVAP13_6NG215103 [Panicum virgatum]|uniref:Uncharacterized protein n=1 Tax=Panicum virgatum TaxID=38727 RepID=A0A8T0QYN6_PANVG|nr:hypothetical protein PVAP13_6NG215103 [Panicum virgatum]